jgi:DNA topoisomerase-1
MMPLWVEAKALLSEIVGTMDDKQVFAKPLEKCEEEIASASQSGRAIADAVKELCDAVLVNRQREAKTYVIENPESAEAAASLKAAVAALAAQPDHPVVLFDGFLALYQEGRDDAPLDDDEDGRLPKVTRGEAMAKNTVTPSQHFTEPPPRFSEASLVKKLEEEGIGRPSTYASILQVLRDRAYVRMDKNRFIPEDKGRLVTAFLESFFGRYVEYKFTASLEEQLDKVSAGELDWKVVLRAFWDDFSAAIAGTKELRVREVLDALDELLGPHIFPDAGTGAERWERPALRGLQRAVHQL